jgi:hypothetical protein
MGATRVEFPKTVCPPPVSRTRVLIPRPASSPNTLPPEKKIAQRRPKVASNDKDAVS